MRALVKLPDLRSEHQQAVDEFMRQARQQVPDEPVLPHAGIRQLRARLILEEALETIECLGFDVVTHIHDGRKVYEFVANGKEDLVGIIDGCCDIKVVTTGTLSACGVPDRPFQHLVDQNNLAKFGPGHSWREDGKLIKPPDHKPPQIGVLLESLMVEVGFFQFGPDYVVATGQGEAVEYYSSIYSDADLTCQVVDEIDLPALKVDGDKDHRPSFQQQITQDVMDDILTFEEAMEFPYLFCSELP